MERLTRDGVLLWLNDRTGRMAQLSVMVGASSVPGSSAATVVEVTGRLIHWRAVVPVEGWADVERLPGDHSGAYRIGAAILYVPDIVEEASASVDEDGQVDALFLPLDRRTSAHVAVADDDHPLFGGGGHE